MRTDFSSVKKPLLRGWEPYSRLIRLRIIDPRTPPLPHIGKAEDSSQETQQRRAGAPLIEEGFHFGRRRIPPVLAPV